MVVSIVRDHGDGSAQNESPAYFQFRPPDRLFIQGISIPARKIAHFFVENGV